MKKISAFGLFMMAVISVNIHGQCNQFNCYYKDNGLTAREHLADFTHLQLSLDFDTIQSKVYGVVTHSFVVLREKLDSIVLDAVDMSVKELKFEGKSISTYKLKNNLLYIYFPKTLKKNTSTFITIQYECIPKRGLYFIGWNDSLHYSQRQIWSQGQGTDNRHWIPMFDDMSDKITQDIIVRFNKKYQVISNGVLVEKKDLKNNITEWHYRMNKPHAPYLIMLAIGKYKTKQYKSKSGVNISAYYYPEKEYCADTTFRFSAQMMDFLEKETGVKYAWEQYSMIPVQEYMYGAMENTTATIFGDFFLVDEYSINDRDFLPVAAHELAHQWFGDLITARSPAHVWLQESFATHYNWLVEKAYFGNEHYDWNRKSVVENILKESEKNLLPIAHSNAGSTRIYPKGAYVLHMLKKIIGKENFDNSIKRYLQKHAYNNVDSHDLLVAIYEETGMYLDWFFDEWIYRGGEPHYKVNYETLQNEKENIGVFYVEQTQKFQDNVYVFKMPIVFELHFSDGTFIQKTEWIDEKSETIQIPFDKNKKVSYVLFDPNFDILKDIDFEKTFEMLVAQAKEASYMLDRYDAIAALSKFNLNQKRKFLQERYWKENYHAIKSEIVKQLINDTNDTETLKIIQDALLKAHPLVNRTVIENTKKIPSSLKPSYFEALSVTKSYINIEKLMWLLFENYPDEYSKIIEATKKHFEKSTGRNVEITALTIEYLKTKNPTSLNKLKLYASPSLEFRTKINAFQALVKINYCDENIKQHLRIASQSANYRLASMAKEVLNHFDKIKSFSNGKYN